MLYCLLIPVKKKRENNKAPWYKMEVRRTTNYRERQYGYKTLIPLGKVHIHLFSHPTMGKY